MGSSTTQNPKQQQIAVQLTLPASMVLKTRLILDLVRRDDVYLSARFKALVRARYQALNVGKTLPSTTTIRVVTVPFGKQAEAPTILMLSPTPASQAPTPAAPPQPTPQTPRDATIAKVKFSSGLAGIAAADFGQSLIQRAYKQELAKELPGVRGDEIMIVNIRPLSSRFLMGTPGAAPARSRVLYGATGVMFDVVITVLQPIVDSTDTIESLVASVTGSVENFRSSMSNSTEMAAFLANVKVALTAAAAADPGTTLSIDDIAFDSFDVSAVTAAPQVEMTVEFPSSERTPPPNSEKDSTATTLQLIFAIVGGAVTLLFFAFLWHRRREQKWQHTVACDALKVKAGTAGVLPSGWQTGIDEK